MKKFQNNIPGYGVNDAVEVAERLLHPDSKMLGEILDKNDWEYDSGTGKEVYNKIVSHNTVLLIYTYRPFWRYSKAIGYFDGKSMHMNLYKLPGLPLIDIVSNILHEKMHQIGFGHGNNYKTEHKCKFSVPYWVSENVKRFL